MAENVTNFGPVRVNGSLAVTEPLRFAGMTAFDETMVAEYTPDIAINSTYGLTDYRLVQTTANGGSIAEDAGTFRLRTGTTANGSASIETAEHGDYNSGSMALAGELVFASRAPIGNEDLTWGYYDANNGFQFGWDATGFYVRLRSGGSDGSKVYQSDMTGDPLDGTGDSQLTIDLLKPNIFRIRMALYGQGPAEMQVLMEDDDSEKTPCYVTVHRFWSSTGALIVENWGLPVKADADNGGDTTSIDLHVGGMQFGVIGKRIRKPRIASQTVIDKSLSGGTIVPIVSLRKKTADEAINALVRGFDTISSDDLIIYVFLDGSLTGASFGSFTNISDGETALEVDTSATAISGGNAIYEKLHVGGQGNRSGLTNADLQQALPNNVPVTLAARKRTGSGGTITATFRAEERW